MSKSNLVKFSGDHSENHPEDILWEELLDEVAEDGGENGMSAADSLQAWKIGLTIWVALKGKMP